MADIRAFRGWRYNLAQVGTLSDVVAPPYDVIGEAEQQALMDRHQANVIRLILNKELPEDHDGSNRYSRAAGFLRDWKADGFLAQDPDPAIYVCHQKFEVEGQEYNRRGFMSRIKIEPFGEGRVYAHEETMAGPKADRLRLFNATGMNLSPIFGLFPDENNDVQETIEAAIRGKTPLEATDSLGVTTRMWLLTDQEVISKVRGLMGQREIFIADGHHRYETATQFRADQLAAGASEESLCNFVMMMCVGMSDPGLAILPTHRLCSNLPAFSSKDMSAALADWFEVESIGEGEQGARDAWELVDAGGQSMLGFGCRADNQWLVARLKSEDAMAQRVPDRSAAWRELAVSVLHELALPQISEQKPPVRYVHLLQEVIDDLQAGGSDLACLVPPATMTHVQDIASGLERMPAKSTYFYPKLLSGLAFNPIT